MFKTNKTIIPFSSYWPLYDQMQISQCSPALLLLGVSSAEFCVHSEESKLKIWVDQSNHEKYRTNSS